MSASPIQTTVTVDAELLAKAASLAEPGVDQGALLKQCMDAFIARQTALRLAALGGQAPGIELAGRRREDLAGE